MVDLLPGYTGPAHSESLQEKKKYEHKNEVCVREKVGKRRGLISQLLHICLHICESYTVPERVRLSMSAQAAVAVSTNGRFF